MNMAERLKVLVLQPDFSHYQAAYYQHQFTMALERTHRVFRYGRRLPHYDTSHTIEDVLELCPFDPDVICFAAGWEVEIDESKTFDPHSTINVSSVDIPSVMILNKEYSNLDLKLQFIQDNDIRLVFTVHRNHRQWADQTGVEFIHFPFAVDEKMFRDYGERKRYSLGFSGNLHERWIDIRRRIKDRIFLKWPIKRPQYWNTRVFWSEGVRIPGFRLPRGEAYARLINRSKLWLSTPSAVDIVGPRFYEVMASKTLLFCSDSSAYEGLFVDGSHCVTFAPNLNDFEDKFFQYLLNDDDRQEIVERGYAHVLENHTWERRIEQFTEALFKARLVPKSDGDAPDM